MAWPGTRAAELLGVRYPLVQAPMSGSDTPELAAAVSNAGGLGSFGGARAQHEELRAAIRRIRELTDRPFAINLFAWNAVEIPDADAAAVVAALAPLYDELGVVAPDVRLPFDPQALLEEQLAVIADERVPVFSFTFGIPPLDDVRASGAVLAGTATTAAEAEALESAGVDVVVAQGSEAGGHRGTFLHEFEDGLIGSLALVPAVVDRVSVPVLAAGGISDGRGIAAALALGATGAQIGTIFLTCPESAASDLHKAMVADRSRPTIVTDRYTGRPVRAFRTRIADELERAGVASLPFLLQQVVTEPIRRAAAEQGRADLAIALAGQGPPRADAAGAADLLGALVAETEQALDRLSDGPAAQDRLER